MRGQVLTVYGVPFQLQGLQGQGQCFWQLTGTQCDPKQTHVFQFTQGVAAF